jgi:hypothetical protein
MTRNGRFIRGKRTYGLSRTRSGGCAPRAHGFPLRGRPFGPRVPMARNRRGVRRWMRGTSWGEHVGVQPRGWRPATPRHGVTRIRPVRPVRPVRSMRSVHPVRWVHLASPTACPTEPNAMRGARLRRKAPPSTQHPDEPNGPKRPDDSKSALRTGDQVSRKRLANPKLAHCHNA